MANVLQDLKRHLSRVEALDAASGLMEWDQQTFMPRGGAAGRARHLGVLAEMRHQQFVSDETARLLESAKAEAEGDLDRALVRVVDREYRIQSKIPPAIAAEKARLSAETHELWVEARAKNNFQMVLGAYDRLFEMEREVAGYLGYADHPYDALVDQYEEGATARSCRSMFDAIKSPLSELVQEIVAQPKVDRSGLVGTWPDATQEVFTRKLVEAIGFDFSRGRQDTAAHPFCGGVGVNDVRLTTRYLSDLSSAIFSSLHEAGHGMYEQGSPLEWDGTPLAGGVSLGVHESQSRLWENIVGRSFEFWQFFWHDLVAAFPSVDAMGIDGFHRAVNAVEPTLIRVEADEVTYNLHVLVRFEIECALIEGSLAMRDVPEAWAEKYRTYLGIVPTNDSAGCLQDVHWSGGLIGYFPTYTMGNLISYQLWKAMERAIPQPFEQISQGNFKAIYGWMYEHIYQHGQRYQAPELVQNATGKSLDPSDYLAAIKAKYSRLYNL